jgi:hypothetical protein
MTLVGLVFHLQADRFAFTSAPGGDFVEPREADTAPMKVEVDPAVAAPPPIGGSTQSRSSRPRVTHRLAPRIRIETPCEPGWHELESGPVGRRVLITCFGESGSPTLAAAPTPHTLQGRMRIPRSRHDRLPWHRTGR